jgi:hypothetical protein
MAAHSIRPDNWKPKKFVASERRRTRSVDPETALGMQLATIVDKLDVQVMVIADYDGACVASAGPESAAMALARLAAGAAKEDPTARTITTPAGFIHVDLVDARGRTFILAAFARHGVPSAIGVARAVNGAARILRDGISIEGEAALPLSERGWGDWSNLD